MVDTARLAGALFCDTPVGQGSRRIAHRSRKPASWSMASRLVAMVRGERRPARWERSKSRRSALMSFTLGFVTADLGTFRLLGTHRVR
jgi:hypothetical protein